MALVIEAPAKSLTVGVRPLNQNDFDSFGTVITNPEPGLIPSKSLSRLPSNSIQANQGSALKYLDVTHMLDLYCSAPSQVPSKAVMNMFVCAPRQLQNAADLRELFKVDILERHPYTTQTFIPLGLSPKEQQQAQYLVIVAPSLPPSPVDESLPVPATSSSDCNHPGRGLPDLNNIKAFIANGAQAVTYAAGTWHAPMVALGKKPIDFIVVQFANGVNTEDCQEVTWTSEASILRVATSPPRLWCNL